MTKFEIIKNAVTNANEYLLNIYENEWSEDKRNEYDELGGYLVFVDDLLDSEGGTIPEDGALAEEGTTAEEGSVIEDETIPEDNADADDSNLMSMFKSRIPLIFEEIKGLDEIPMSFKVFYLAIKSMCDVMESEDFNVDIELTNWDVESVQLQKCGNLVYSNASDQDHEMMLIDATNIDKTELFFEGCQYVSPLFRLMHYYNIGNTYEWMLVRNNACEKERCLSFLKMYDAYKGNSRIQPVTYSYNAPNITIQFDPNLDYRQHLEIVEVMDEYNCQNSLLDRFLRIYQALEYNAYKYRICLLCDSTHYGKLSVRNFKDLGEMLNKTERESIKDFMKNCLSVTIGGQSMGVHIYDIWNIKVNTNTGNQTFINNTLSLLGIQKTKSGNNRLITFTNPNNQGMADMISLIVDLIYQMRCSIVHDKVNEYHITYTNLDSNIVWVIKEVLLPIMEKLIYGLMFVNNNLTVYTSRELRLY